MKLFAWIMPSAVLALSLLILFDGVSLLLDARASREWPTVQGRVMHSGSELAPTQVVGDRAKGFVRYGYEVESVVYQGMTVSFGAMPPDLTAPSQVSERYPVDSDVTVHYEPGNPSNAVLIPGSSRLTWIMPGVGLCMLLVLVPMMAFVASKIAKRTPSLPKT